MSKKLKIFVITGVIIFVLVIGMMIVYPYPFFGPFENPPTGAGGNCGLEYRFKVDTKIQSVSEFIQFLKDHQYEGNLTSDYEPTINKLIPDHTSPNTQTKLSSPIDLVVLEANATITKSNAIFSNEKIYTLVIENQDFGDNWPWRLTIRMSETGYISIKHCAGV
ncbi:MAG: hypothetical protein IMZ43_03565 [Thermoplasmata archaeon]|nr:hypothetical protein [Actinomycetota bacterium]MBE3136458.1 hypothetical protein [Thermoplasmata archaeon]MBE3139813.1 hypothetical protein [Thermoplasmata archaeon]